MIISTVNGTPPKYDSQYWQAESNDVDGVIDRINKGMPLLQINYDVKENKIIEGTDTYIALDCIVTKQMSDDIQYYINIETGIISNKNDTEFDFPSYLFFDNMKLTKWCRCIELITLKHIDKIDAIYTKLNFYKVVLNELHN